MWCLLWDVWRIRMGCSLVMVTGDVGIGMWLGWMFDATGSNSLLRIK